jgi:hypothetical protein
MSRASGCSHALRQVSVNATVAAAAPSITTHRVSLEYSNVIVRNENHPHRRCLPVR